MRRSSNFKGEFFLLTVFTIITFLFVISLWIKPSEIIDTSKVVLSEEVFVFNNVKEKVIEVINSSKTCEDLNFSLEEFKKFVGLLVFPGPLRKRCMLLHLPFDRCAAACTTHM